MNGLNAMFNQKPVKLLQNGSDMVDGRGPRDIMDGGVLDKLELMNF